MKEELNLDLMNMVSKDSPVNKKKADKMEKEQAAHDIDTTLKILRQKQLGESFYRKSLQDKQNTKNQKIFGKTYVGKNVLKTSILMFSVAAGVILVGKTANATIEISHYNHVLEQKMNDQLTQEEKENYEMEHNHPIFDSLEIYQNIQDAKDTLDSHSYDFQGNNNFDVNTEYLPVDEGIVNLSEKDQDAINIATDQVISEYKERSR